MYLVLGGQSNPNSMINVARNAGGANADKFINNDGQNINYGSVITGQQWNILNLNENTNAPFTNLNINGNSQTIDNFMPSPLNANTVFRIGDWATSP